MLSYNLLLYMYILYKKQKIQVEAVFPSCFYFRSFMLRSAEKMQKQTKPGANSQNAHYYSN